MQRPAEVWLRPAAGFTLLEVLVAMAIVAIALLGLLKLAAHSVDLRGHLENRSLAMWVAQNHVAELRLQKNWPALGKRQGTANLAGRIWDWQQQVSATADPGIRQVDVLISHPASSTRFLLVAYMHKSLGG